MEQIENWETIKNYEGLYEISNHGRVRSLDRFVNGRYTNKAFAKGRILIPNKNGTGYLAVSLCFNGNQKNTHVHRLIATYFIPNPYNLPQVNHKDGNKQNNNLDNLEWVTHKENIRHAVRTGLLVAPKGNKSHMFNKCGLRSHNHKIVKSLKTGEIVTLKQAAIIDGYCYKYMSRMIIGNCPNNSSFISV